VGFVGVVSDWRVEGLADPRAGRIIQARLESGKRQNSRLGGGGRSEMRTGLRCDFPVNKENTGNFACLAGETKSDAKNVRVAAAPGAIPYKNHQGIFHP
jgi:hypothetical protein